jgi:hypothetical protein
MRCGGLLPVVVGESDGHFGDVVGGEWRVTVTKLSLKFGLGVFVGYLFKVESE